MRIAYALEILQKQQQLGINRLTLTCPVPGRLMLQRYSLGQ
jgi:hypothetical protein